MTNLFADPALVFRGILKAREEVTEAQAKPAAQVVRPQFDPAAALAELQSTPRPIIEQNTALSWAGRAVAAYTLAVRQGALVQRVDWFTTGDDYGQEAREHAALVGDGGKTLDFVEKQLRGPRQLAMRAASEPVPPL